jgi:hypothetical protein
MLAMKAWGGRTMGPSGERGRSQLDRERRRGATTTTQRASSTLERNGPHVHAPMPHRTTYIRTAPHHATRAQTARLSNARRRSRSGSAMAVDVLLLRQMVVFDGFASRWRQPRHRLFVESTPNCFEAHSVQVGRRRHLGNSHGCGKEKVVAG